MNVESLFQRVAVMQCLLCNTVFVLFMSVIAIVNYGGPIKDWAVQSIIVYFDSSCLLNCLK